MNYNRDDVHNSLWLLLSIIECYFADANPLLVVIVVLLPGSIKRGFWVLLTILTLSLLLFNLYTICKSFFAYKVNVNVKMLNKRELTFPTVTICNMNPFKKSALSESPILEELLGESSSTKNKKRRRKRATCKKKRTTNNSLEMPVSQC